MDILWHWKFLYLTFQSLFSGRTLSLFSGDGIQKEVDNKSEFGNLPRIGQTQVTDKLAYNDNN
jgi:hypothetical protein